MFIKIQTAESKTKHLEQKIDDLIERHRNDQEFWMKEKGELLRRLGSMRNVHNRDTRRTEDILTGVSRPLDKSAYWQNIFLISQPTHMLWVLKRSVSFEHPKHMFKLIGKKIITILRYIFFFLLTGTMGKYSGLTHICLMEFPTLINWTNEHQSILD